MFYALNKMKATNSEITCENINSQRKYLREKYKFTCYGLENKDGEYNVTIRVEERRSLSYDTGVIHSDYTFSRDVFN